MPIKKYDLEWCKNYAQEHGGELLTLEYLGPTKKHLYRCKNGHEFEAVPTTQRSKKSWCNECSNRDVAHTIDFVRQFVESKKGLLFSTEYKNVRTKLDVQCSSGHRWSPTFQNIYHNKSWCPVCAGVDKRTYGKKP